MIADDMLLFIFSHIILMIADDMACNPRNPRPGQYIKVLSEWASEWVIVV